MVLYRLLFFLVGAGLVALVVQVFRKPVETARAVAGFLGGDRARARVRADPSGIREGALFAAIVAAIIFAFGLVGVISDLRGASAE